MIETRSSWASDVLAQRLVELGIRQVYFTAGSSFRGLFDSFGALPEGVRPTLTPCLHEEHAVSMAHGAAKVSGHPAVVLVHSNVGFLHALMAIYNAYCDRVPMLILGATGPFDAAVRRPWIDWVHTMGDQGALARAFLKWDDQPTSLEAALDSVDRAVAITSTAPFAPTLVTFDIEMLESSVAQPPVQRPRPPAVSGLSADAATVQAVAAACAEAESPAILMGRMSRDSADWERRIELAERLGAAVFTDMKVAAAFPSDHPLHAGTLGLRNQRFGRSDALAGIDLVLSFDWVDLAGLEPHWRSRGEGRPLIISVSVDEYLHNGGTRDHQRYAAVDRRILASPDQLVSDLLVELRRKPGTRLAERQQNHAQAPDGSGADPELAVLANALRATVGSRPACLVRVPLSWDETFWPLEGPLDYLGSDGGGGLGSGPGMAIGAAWGLHEAGILPLAVIGDGDYLMGINALWSAARRTVPLLLVVIDNGGYLNEQLHQVDLARKRDRLNPLSGLGSVLDSPAIDLAALAAAQGFSARSCSIEDDSLASCFASALEVVDNGEPALVVVGMSDRLAAN